MTTLAPRRRWIFFSFPFPSGNAYLHTLFPYWLSCLWIFRWGCKHGVGCSSCTACFMAWEGQYTDLCGSDSRCSNSMRDVTVMCVLNLNLWRRGRRRSSSSHESHADGTPHAYARLRSRLNDKSSCCQRNLLLPYGEGRRSEEGRLRSMRRANARRQADEEHRKAQDHIPLCTQHPRRVT